MKEEKKCIVCGNPSKYDLCLDCYKEKDEIKRELEGSISTFDETKDYYNNLKYNIFRLKNMKYARTGCLKLYALSEVLEKRYHVNGAIDKAKDDISSLLDKKEKYLDAIKNKSDSDKKGDNKLPPNIVIENDSNVKSDIQDYRRIYPMNFRCKDGHYVRSKVEVLIDDYLFDNQIIHVYEQRIINEDNDEEYYPDFFLPTLGRSQRDNLKTYGIYIEYFGLEDDEKYKATADKKLKYYNSQGYDVIVVRPINEGNVRDYLEKEIRTIKKKYR